MKKIDDMILVYILLCIVYAQTVSTKSAVDPEVADSLLMSNGIVNPHDFKYLKNPEENICGPEHGAHLFILVYVHTTPSKFQRRLAIRETWGSVTTFPKMRVVFMMGDEATSHEHKDKVHEMIEYEQDLYGDIVQENFIDSYRNLTYKGIMAMKWIGTYCSKAKYILKVDDDIVVNMFAVWQHLKHMEKNDAVPKRAVICNVWDGMIVVREKQNKWYVQESEYASDRYGVYCSGSAYMFTSDLAKKMYNASLHVRFFWVDDYYITGLLARMVHAKYKPINSVYIISSGLVAQRFKSTQSDSYLFGHTGGNVGTIYKSWWHLYRKHLFSRGLIANTFSDFKITNSFKW